MDGQENDESRRLCVFSSVLSPLIFIPPLLLISSRTTTTKVCFHGIPLSERVSRTYSTACCCCTSAARKWRRRRRRRRQCVLKLEDHTAKHNGPKERKGGGGGDSQTNSPRTDPPRVRGRGGTSPTTKRPARRKMLAGQRLRKRKRKISSSQRGGLGYMFAICIHARTQRRKGRGLEEEKINIIITFFAMQCLPASRDAALGCPGVLQLHRKMRCN